MAVTMENIKKLREITGAGMMDVKKALDASNNDIDAAIEWLKENGLAKAAKKANRVAAEGIVKAVSSESKAVLFEINTETDFVATNEMFLTEVKKMEKAFIETSINLDDKDKVLSLEIDGESIEEIMTRLTATIGEKIEFRRATSVNGKAGAYTHNGKVAVLVQGNAESSILRQIGMHVAAMQPKYISIDTIDPKYKAEVEKELTADYSKKMAEKPAHILENIIKGAISKKLAEDTLEEQEFVVNPSQKVKEAAGGKLDNVVIFNLGEGIEKVESDFAAEVAAAVKG